MKKWKQLFLFTFFFLILLSSSYAIDRTQKTSEFNFHLPDSSEPTTSDELWDSSNHSNNHNGTIVNGVGFQYSTTSPSGSGYYGDFSTASYFNLINISDYGNIDKFHISFAIREASGYQKPIFSADNTDIRVRTANDDFDFTLNGA